MDKVLAISEMVLAAIGFSCVAAVGVVWLLSGRFREADEQLRQAEAAFKQKSAL